MYTKYGATTIGKLYLLALATVVGQPIPHLQPEAFYEALLAGKEYVPQTRRRRLIFLEDGADETMAAQALRRPRVGPPRKRRRRRRLDVPGAEPLEDGPIDEEEAFFCLIFVCRLQHQKRKCFRNPTSSEGTIFFSGFQTGSQKRK